MTIDVANQNAIKYMTCATKEGIHKVSYIDIG